MKSRIAILCLAIAGLSSCVSTEYQPPIKIRLSDDGLAPFAFVQSTCAECFVLTNCNR